MHTDKDGRERPDTEAESILEFAKENLFRDLIHVIHPEEVAENIQVAMVADGLELKSLKKFADEYRTRPERREGQAVFCDLDSFIAHACRFKDDDSAVFAATGDTPRLVSVIDYHRPGPDGHARFGRHRGLYQFPLSEEWRAWAAANGTALAQGDFAGFLEDRVIDVVEAGSALPETQSIIERLGVSIASPNRLLELARGLTIRVDSTVTNALRLDSGETQFTYSEEHKDGAGAPLKVPNAFLLQIPIFRDGAPYQILVRLRYRQSGGKIAWICSLHRPERSLDHAVKEACAKVAAETSLPVFAGSPES